MVNPGHPSGACETCKVRRVKCDENRPQCHRCTRSRRTCLGYRSLSTVQKRQHLKREQQISQHHRNSTEAIYRRNMLLSASLQTDQIAVNFAENFMLVPSSPNLCPGFLDGLESVLAQSDNHGLLKNALVCVTITYDSLSEPVETLEERSRLHNRYQAAIRDTRISLCLPRKSISLMTTVFLFALFEVCVRRSSVLSVLALT